MFNGQLIKDQLSLTSASTLRSARHPLLRKGDESIPPHTCLDKVFIVKSGKMAQWIRPEDLNSVPRTHTVEEDIPLVKVTFCEG